MVPPESERREVRSEDSSLSPEANRLLTEELRQAVGSDEVEVPVGTPDRREDRHGGRSSLVASILANRVLFVISLLALVTVGVIVSLATDSWWALVAACGVHAAGTLLTATLAVRMTTQVEHVDPTTAARLEAEGVEDPDRVLSDLAEDFAGAQQARGAAEVVSTGNNENRADLDADPAQAGLEQRTVMTPSARGSQPAGSGSAIALIPVGVVAGLLVITLVVAIAEGGAVWLLPAIVWAAGAVWLALTLKIDGPAEERAAREDDSPKPGGPDRRPGDTATGARSRLVPVMAVVVMGVMGFCVLVALLMTTL